MAYGADSLIQVQDDVHLRQMRQKRDASAMRAAHQQIVLKVEMLVGAWCVDEFGNQTREIKARD